MLKRLDGPGSAYAPSARADAWLKLKRDYVAELRDSLDLVPIGAWRGVGRKRAGSRRFSSPCTTRRRRRTRRCADA